MEFLEYGEADEVSKFVSYENKYPWVTCTVIVVYLSLISKNIF